MAGQRGLEMLIRMNTGTAAVPVWTTVAGLRSKTFTLNKDTVDVTDADSVGRWRELLGGAGVKSMSVSGEGVFKDQTPDEAVRAAFFQDTITDFQLLVPSFGTFTGLFDIPSIEYAGEHAGEITFSMSLESAGPITFAAI